MKLEICNIRKQYGKKIALDNLSYVFSPGVYGILGPNGAGKTTLMNLIASILRPDKDSGRIYWNGKDIYKLGSLYREHIGYMPQQQNTYPSMSALRFMGYMSSLKGIDKHKSVELSKQLLEKVELLDVADKHIGGFSGGMKQRLLLASAMIGHPEILILDEPTAGLDPRQRVIIRDQIAQYGKDNIIIVVTHILSDIESIADSIVMMRSGRIICEGNMDNIVKDENGQKISLEKLYMNYYGESLISESEEH